MKRKYSDSSHYWISTDPGTTYSALDWNARHWQKRVKRDQMRRMYKEYTDPVLRELLIPPNVKARHDRLVAKRKHEAEHFGRARKVVVRELPYVEKPPISGWDITNAVVSTANYAQAGATVGGLAGLAAAGPSGAAIGEAIGGVGGAVVGVVSNARSIMGDGLPNKKMVKPANLRVDKSAMVKTGKVKVKKRKVVRVSSYLKSAIKQVSQGLTAQGLYKRTISGLIGYATQEGAAVADLQITATAMGTSQIVGYIPSGSAKVAGHKTWWNTLNERGTASNPLPQPQHDMNFFTPGKIWHAASVLFNQKAETSNPYDTTDNLSTINVDATGVPVVSAQNLKINVKKSYAQFTFKNLSARTVFLDVYECVPTMKFNNANPLQDLVVVGNQIQDSSTADCIVQVFERGAEMTTTAPSQLFITDSTTDTVAVCKANGWKWKYVKRSMMLASGEVCVHTVDGPSGLLDLQKCFDPRTSNYQTANHLSNWSKGVIMSVRPDPILRSAGNNYGVPIMPIVTGAAVMYGLVSVQVNEVISLAVPEVAGFTSNPVAAGKGQPLNLRKKRYQFTNLSVGYETAINNLVNTTEFNPVAEGSNVLTQ